MARKARAPSWLKTAEAREEWRRVRHQAVDAGALNIYLQAFDVHAQASREWREHVDSGAGMIIVDQAGNVRANPVYAVVRAAAVEVRAAAKSAGVWVAPDAGHVEERDDTAGAEMLRLLRGGGDDGDQELSIPPIDTPPIDFTATYPLPSIDE